MQIKKLLGSTLALAMILPSASVNAELLKNFKLSGQLDLEGTSAKNIKDFSTNGNVPGAVNANDRIGSMQTRLLLSADWDMLDDVHSKVTLSKNNRDWGNQGGAPGGVANGHGNAQSEAVDGGGLLAQVFVDQAYVKIDKVMGSVDTTLGRQFYGNSGDMIIYFGPSDKALWGMPVNALDTARFDWANDMIGLTGIVGKIAGAAIGGPATLPEAGTDLRGIVASLKSGQNASGALSVYNRVIHNLGVPGANPSNVGAGTAGGKNDNLWVADLKGKVTMGGAWASAEFAKNFGNQRGASNAGNAGWAAARNYDGWAFKLDLGDKVDLNGAGAVTGWANFGYGTGDGDASSAQNSGFTSINGDFRPGSIYGRFSNAQGATTVFAGGLGAPAGFPAGTTGNAAFANNGSLTNRVLWGLGAKITPASANKLTAGVSFWDFRSQTAMLPVSAPNLNRAYGGNKHIGSEIDVDLEWKHSENVSFDTGVGRFYAGGAIKEAIQQTNANGNAGGTIGSGNGNSPASLAYFDVRVKF